MQIAAADDSVLTKGFDSENMSLPLREWLRSRAHIHEKILDETVGRLEAEECFDASDLVILRRTVGLEAVLKTTCYLGDISMYADFNEGARARARCDPRRSRVLSRGAQYWRLCHAFEVARCASRSSRAPQSTSSSSRTPRRARRACASPSTSCRWARSSRSNARRT